MTHLNYIKNSFLKDIKGKKRLHHLRIIYGKKLLGFHAFLKATNWNTKEKLYINNIFILILRSC